MAIGRRWLAAVALLLAAAALRPQTGTQPAAKPAVEFSSSNPELTAAFTWARQQALGYQRQNFIGPWYEAALPGRNAFCMRDVAHQTDGAEMLGLHAANQNMLTRFARSAARSRDWAAYWEIDAQGRPSTADYRSDTDFWFNLPANFDVLAAMVRASRWSGDPAWLNHPNTREFIFRTLSEYLDLWQLRSDKILTRPRLMNQRQQQGEFVQSRGIPGYHEETLEFTVGADLAAAELSSLRSFAEIAADGNEKVLAVSSATQAAQLQSIVENRFWLPAERHFAAVMGADGKLAGRGDVYLLHFDAVSDPAKLSGALDSASDPAYWQTVNIEEESYLPLALFRYGRAEMAYRVMLDLAAPSKARREYPEVSFTVVADLIEGAMGIAPGPLNSGWDVETWPRPRDAKQTAEVHSLPLHGGAIDVVEEGAEMTRLTNHTPLPLRWKATFPAAKGKIVAGGKEVKTRQQRLPDGQTASYALMVVPPGATVEARLK